MEQPPYALVVDDHALVARGLAHFLQSVHPDWDVVSRTRWSEAMDLPAQRGSPHLLVADVWLGDDSSLSAMQAWRRICPDTPWLAISGDDDPTLAARVRAAGAQGFVHKQVSPERFAQAVLALISGQLWFTPDQADVPTQAPDRRLTPRQEEILGLLLRGLPNKRIARELGITEATVKEHVTAILSHLGVRNRVEAITALSRPRSGALR